MSNENRFNAEEKLKIIKEVESYGSIMKVSRKYSTRADTIRLWKKKYEKYGISALQASSTTRKYSVDLIESAVKSYLAGEGSYQDVAFNYNIASSSSVQRWVKWYHEGRSFVSISGGKDTMKKAKKTTYEERLKIVYEYFANGESYQEIIDKYGVTYRQINSWVNKYKKSGKEGLKDRRGKAKKEEDLTELDVLKAENKKLKKELAEKELEVKFLKKLEELEKKYFKA